MRLPPVPPGAAPSLRDEDAFRSDEPSTKAELRQRLAALTRRLDALQRGLYAEGRRALLVVLQGRDTSGKDGTIRRVFSRIDPLGLEVTSFKAPTERELRHDFLWRIHQAAPSRGAVGIFNRSHYEDVLVARVRRLVPESVWRPRYEQINLFERILVENGTVILKFMLHVSREEQRKRLLARLEDPEKHWKFNANDLEERKLWEAYTEAYREALARTSTDLAPWYVVPADKKGVRNVLIAETVVAALEAMDPRYPGPPAEVEALRRLLG